PVIVQKSDGGYLYATTDLAAANYRGHTLSVDRSLYVVGAPQKLHLQQVFTVAKRAGFMPEDREMSHHAFGSMMGSDGKPFKTREGGTVKLIDLLDEAVERAYQLVSEKNPEQPEKERREIAEVVGIGSVKYADLSKNRTNDYMFNWDTMLSMEGNTAPYLQYAYARINSIFTRAGERPDGSAAIHIDMPEERALGIKLMQFPEVVESVARDCYPHQLCVYLYELAGAYMRFYEACPVLKAEADTRQSRLGLCGLTASVLKTGLDLLGIDVLDRM
ncbi:MAG: arginine--tRNA ligase, partial [Pseudomonadota bacterium]